MIRKRPTPDCKLRDPTSTRNCPYSLYCAACDMDDDLSEDEDG